MKNEKIKKIIMDSMPDPEEQSVVTIKDFIHLAPYTQILTCLQELTESKLLRRLEVGCYDRPYISRVTKKEASPNIRKLAEAVGRFFNSFLVLAPCHYSNFLGISTQLPAKYVYESIKRCNGSHGDAWEIQYKPSLTYLIGLSFNSVALIQAIRDFRDQGIGELEIAILAKRFTYEELDAILLETRYIPGTIYEQIRSIRLKKG